MVCFTRHQFNFTDNNASNWFQLLCKYYPTVGITVQLDNEESVTGKITMDFFQSLPKSTTYHIVTDRFWSELGVIRALPKYQRMDGTCDVELANTIDGLLKSRLSYGGCEVLLETKLDVSNFDQIVQVIPHLKTQNITRQYISHSLKCVFLVLKDRHTMQITTERVSDGFLPIFDVDDGFGSGQIAEELNGHFEQWSKKFKNSNGDTWDDEIINQNVVKH